MPEVPALFERIPEHLLVPLASPLKRIYWEALLVAYDLHQSADRYEIAKETLLDRVEEHLQELPPAQGETPFALEADQADAEPADLSGTRLFAWRLLKQLERCGWFEYEYHRDLGQALRFPDYALTMLFVL
jgi:hypothetical protein